MNSFEKDFKKWYKKKKKKTPKIFKNKKYTQVCGICVDSFSTLIQYHFNNIITLICIQHQCS